MKKYLSVAILGLAVSCMAADTNLFKANEIGLKVGADYTFDKGPNQSEYNFGFNAGVEYFLTKHFGFEVSMPFYEKNGISVHEVSFGALFRVPVKRFAPYLGLGAAYDWAPTAGSSHTYCFTSPCVPETYCEDVFTPYDDLWSYYVKLGVEWRFAEHWGLYAEGAYTIESFNKWEDGSFSVGLGVRLSF